MFDRLIWQRDRVLFDGLVFRLEHGRSDTWEGGDHFRFFKTRELVDQYEAFFALRPDFKPSRLLEIGIFDGGSTAFWNEILRPTKHVAVDIMARSDSPYFVEFVRSRGRRDAIRTCWEYDQADKTALRALVDAEFGGRLEMVIDDASHHYEPTRASFEALFPLCVPGGLYVIEDWAWDHWNEFSAADHPWAGQKRLTQLVIELVEAAGTSTQLISTIAVYQGFVAIERGPLEFADPAYFDLEQHITRRPIRQAIECNPGGRGSYSDAQEKMLMILDTTRLRTLIVAATLAVFATPVLAAGQPDSATGAGFIADGRVFAFTAIRHLDGSVSGEGTLIRTGLVSFHFSVDCLEVNGNVATLTGVITENVQANGSTSYAGNRFFFRVVDNGGGGRKGTRDADQMSGSYFNTSEPCEGDDCVPVSCSNFEEVGLAPISSGNIQVQAANQRASSVIATATTVLANWFGRPQSGQRQQPQMR